MSEYDKLTVVRLRDELVKRGLPKTGLKAALIQRLQEADAQVGERDSVPQESSTEAPRGTALDEVPVPCEESTPIFESKDPFKKRGAGADDDAQAIPGAEAEAGDDSDHREIPELVGGDATLGEKGSETILKTPQDGQHFAQPSLDLPIQATSTESPVSTSHAPQDSQNDIVPSVMTQPPEEPEPSFQLPTPAQTQSQQTVMTPMPDTQEILEDSRKRKRRSQSPPPSSIDTKKRLKADNAIPHVEPPEDDINSERALDQGMDATVSPDAALASDCKPLANGHASLKHRSVTPTPFSTMETDQPPFIKPGDEMHAPLKTTDSPVKPSPSDTRFKNLFTAPKADPSSEQPPYSDTEDRAVSPAIHPATAALYIRELMRPLKPESVRDHLVALAIPPDASIDPTIITNFFLDSIRTHCLVEFANISAASRVRSGLHDRIWPNERDRRPLYVDFIPEEKLKKWIDVEQNAPSGRGHPQKRWEVVYEDEDGMIKAYLQEVGTNSGGLRAAQPAKPDAGQGVKGAPSGPRIKGSEPQAGQARPDNGKGFQALDDLFKSTSAKPKLYYQPVSKATVDQRQNKLAAGRGGGRSDEMRRYTFEEDVLVDKAPEFGNRGRGGYGSRGGFAGSYRARGGSYRGDGYRGEADTRRDRRFGY